MQDIKKITRKLFVKNLSLVMVALIVPIVILGVYSYYQLYSASREQSINTNIQVFNQTKELFEIMANDVNSVIKVVAGDTSTIKKLSEIKEKNISEYNNLLEIKSMIETLSNIEISTKYFNSVYYYNEKETEFILNTSVGIVNERNFYDYSWIDEFNKLKNNNMESSLYIRQAYVSPLENKRTITHILRIPVNRAEKTGAFIINLNMDYINKLIDQISNDQGISFTIWNEDSVLLSNDIDIDDSKVPSLEIGTDTNHSMQKDKVYVYAGSKYNNWNYIMTIPFDNIKATMSPVIRTTILIAFFCVVIGVVLSLLVTRRSYIPIKNIFNMINKVQEGENVKLLELHPNDAYGVLSRNIISNFVKAKELENDLVIKQLEIERMNYQVLQSQLNPHFLFNVLDSIKWSAVSLTHSANDTSDMIEYLSELLKYSISDPYEMISLENEVKYCENYIYLLKIKYGEKLYVKWDLDDNLSEYKSYKMILQPLLENSIRHGFKDFEKRSKIKVRIRISSSHINIKVIDNGRGMSTEKLNELKRELNSSKKSNYSHIGLFNIKRRLKIASGEEDVIKIYSKLNFGTCIQLRLPIKD